jgi:hypothetical protein
MFSTRMSAQAGSGAGVGWWSSAPLGSYVVDAHAPRAWAPRRRSRGLACYEAAVSAGGSGSPYQFVPGSPRMRAAPSRIDVTIDW